MFLFHLAYANKTRFNINWFASASSPQNKLQPVLCKSWKKKRRNYFSTVISGISNFIDKMKSIALTFANYTLVQEKKDWIMHRVGTILKRIDQFYDMDAIHIIAFWNVFCNGALNWIIQTLQLFDAPFKVFVSIMKRKLTKVCTKRRRKTPF